MLSAVYSIKVNYVESCLVIFFLENQSKSSSSQHHFILVVFFIWVTFLCLQSSTQQKKQSCLLPKLSFECQQCNLTLLVVAGVQVPFT